MKPLLAYLSLVGLGLFAGCSGRERPSAQPAQPPVRVATTSVVLEAVDEYSALPGTVRPVERAAVAAKVSGTIEGLRVTLGQRVTAGQLLGRISAPEFSARLRQAQAQLAQAERDLARERELLAQNASPADLVKSLQDRVTLTRAMVGEAEAMQEYTAIRAPFEGVIAGKFVNSGDLAMPGLVLLALEGGGGIQVEVAVPFDLMQHAKPGSVVRVEVPETAVTYAGTLAEIAAAVAPDTRTVAVKINVTGSPALLSGEFVRALWPAGQLRALTVPASALSVLEQMERVFVVVDGHAQLRIIRSGFRRADRMQIQAGLEAGEIVVLSPPATLRDGSVLEIAP